MLRALLPKLLCKPDADSFGTTEVAEPVDTRCCSRSAANHDNPTRGAHSGLFRRIEAASHSRSPYGFGRYSPRCRMKRW